MQDSKEYKRWAFQRQA